jgi:hypothetical protein
MKKIVDEDFKTVYNSCMEGLSGDWDCSTDEGREGFRDMIELLDRIADRFNISLPNSDGE